VPSATRFARGADNGAPARLDDRRRVRLRDDRGPVERVAGAQPLAKIERRVVPASAGEHSHDLRGFRLSTDRVFFNGSSTAVEEGAKLGARGITSGSTTSARFRGF
jgi:hypothetical protein